MQKPSEAQTEIQQAGESLQIKTEERKSIRRDPAERVEGEEIRREDDQGIRPVRHHMAPILPHMEIMHPPTMDPDPQRMSEFMAHHIKQTQRGAGKKPEQADQPSNRKTPHLLAAQKSAMGRAF